MKVLHLALLLPLAALLAGCETTKPPLPGDEAYPTDWPGISSLGKECRNLDGLYANEGVVAAPPGVQEAILLTSILPRRVNRQFTKTNCVALKVHTRKTARNGTDTFATLEISIKDEPDYYYEHKECYCIGQAFFYSAGQWGGAFPGWMGGGQMNVWLTSSEDGSLIAKIWHYNTGVAVVVPYYKQNYVWARFNRMEE